MSRTACSRVRPLVGLKRVEAFESQEAVRGSHERGAVIPAQPRATFVVVQAELSFELAVVELDLPAQARQPREAPGRGGGGQVRDPVVSRLRFAFGPFGDQPLLAWGDLRARAPALVVRAPVMRGVDAHEHKARLAWPAVRS